jgi:hypothetical protein
MTLLADPSIREFASGMECELVWSKDETMTTLYITRRDVAGKERKHKIVLSTLELDELREFLSANLQ